MKFIPDDVDFGAWFDAPSGVKIRKASEFRDDLKRTLFMPPETPRVVTGFENMLGKFDIRESEMTVWAGPNGQGKSMVTTQVGLSMCEQGQTVCLASVEMKPHKTLERMACMAYGTNDLTPRMVDDFMSWTNGRLWMYDHVGSVDPKEMVGVVRYAVTELGIQQFVVDNLQKCIVREDDYNGQKDFADRLFAIAKDSRSHVHLVHHTRKVDGMPTKNDVKGASSITDLVDNVILVYRNMHKERVADGKEQVKKQEEYEQIMNQPDVYLDLVKQRHSGFEGCFGYWKSSECPQFVERRGAAPKLYRMVAQKPHSEVDLEEAF